MNDQVGVLNNTHRNPNLIVILDPRINTRRVDPSHDQSAQIDRDAHVITCRPCDVGDQRDILPDERVEQRRFSDVGPPHCNHGRWMDQSIEHAISPPETTAARRGLRARSRARGRAASCSKNTDSVANSAPADSARST